jgi:hypothetical protein
MYLKMFIATVTDDPLIILLVLNLDVCAHIKKDEAKVVVTLWKQNESRG